MFFLIIPYVTPKLFTLFSIWSFIIDISDTIHLLINSFRFWANILLILYWVTFSSCLVSFTDFAWSRCYSSSVTYSFFLYAILPFKFLIFFVPPYLSSLMTFSGVYVFSDFIYRFFNPSFPTGFLFLLFLLP